MTKPEDIAVMHTAQSILAAAGMIERSSPSSTPRDMQYSQIHSDGSTRRFWRAELAGHTRCIIVAPAGRSSAELAESRAAWQIGSHLYSKGVAVPEIYGWDAESGILVFEDLGDTRLHDHVVGENGRQSPDNSLDLAYYHAALQQLVTMQFAGAVGFDQGWCWDTPRYDVSLMLERESGYFLRSFWQGLLQQAEMSGVDEEFREIATVAGTAPSDYFLHRDFQSRNIMIVDRGVRFIDFQGGRLGPLGYDVASLLIDPYVALANDQQEELLAYYVRQLVTRHPGSEKEFYKYYGFLSIQRNLQIIGAFAFLSKNRGKVFFKDFIRPALVLLRERLADQNFSNYLILRGMVDTGLAMLKK